jgi:hypothetical protein
MNVLLAYQKKKDLNGGMTDIEEKEIIAGKLGESFSAVMLKVRRS